MAGLRNGIDVTTTPEGFKFVYQQFAKAVRDFALNALRPGAGLDVRQRKNLPADYIPSLMESYPPELIKAYLRGQFTNLTSGTIYHQFDRQLNNCHEEEQPGEPLYIGMDFNVGKMAGIVHVLRFGLPCAVTEIIKAYDTRTLFASSKSGSGYMTAMTTERCGKSISTRTPRVTLASQPMPVLRISHSLNRLDLM
ncbi:terminase family protein [Klebsiella pneumoniae]|uniref:Terminase family protein n=1 Tax=Klebsiella pneumoniae TaxID=573 RepID=A0A939NQY0_KLEPN|nr:terminase family protein [Klebsiella pneumoniae]